MNNIFLSFLLTSLAGLSTLIGFLVIYMKSNNNKILIRSLSFAAGVMTSVSLIDLIPSSICYLINNYFFVFACLVTLTSIVFGITFSVTIDKYLNVGDDKIYHLGILSMIVILLHNIPEGIATFMTSSSNFNLGLSLSIAIALHNIPEGISIAVPIYYSTKNKKKAFLYTALAGFAEPFGAIIAFLFLKKIYSNIFMGVLLAIIAGIMIQISISEFMPTAFKYKKYKETIIFFLIGALIMILSHII